MSESKALSDPRVDIEGVSASAEKRNNSTNKSRYLVDPASSIRLSKRLSHASVSVNL